MTRILFSTDFHISKTVFRKLLVFGIQYKANVLIESGDVTGKAMVPASCQGNGRYVGFISDREEVVNFPGEIEIEKKIISDLGFYPTILKKTKQNQKSWNPIRNR